MGDTHLLVPGLQPHTQYQFSVLAQNKLGSGPFSEIVLSIPEGKSSPPPYCTEKDGEGQGVWDGWEKARVFGMDGEGQDVLGNLGWRC